VGAGHISNNLVETLVRDRNKLDSCLVLKQLTHDVIEAALSTKAKPELARLRLR